MRLHWLQHVTFEDLGMIAVWAERHDIEVTGTPLFASRETPPPSEYDWLVVMGGPMNVYEEERHPWLAAEKRAIRDAVDAGKVVLGVCLGAQLVADVLGGTVERNPVPEIGWFPVRLTPEGKASRVFRTLPPVFTPFHWHGDVARPPVSCWITAASDACPVQAFSYEDRVIGLQFHLESTETSIGRLVAHCREDLADVPTVQPVARLRGFNGELSAITDHMNVFLDTLHDLNA